MAVNYTAPQAEDLLPVAGVRIGVTEAGIRKANRKDLTVFLLDEGSAVGAVFTQNRYAAAPVQVCRDHLAAGQGIRAMVINTGNANAGTGEPGLQNARQTANALALALGVPHEQVLPFSTGVIMEPLPLDRLLAGLPAALSDAGGAEGATGSQWLKAAEGIMTTDTQPKAISRQAVVGGKTVTVSGIAKGAGMIRPNMATMLGFIATDACVSPAIMQALALARGKKAGHRALSLIEGNYSLHQPSPGNARQSLERLVLKWRWRIVLLSGGVGTVTDRRWNCHRAVMSQI